MKKKVSVLASIVVLLIGLAIYFRPLHFSVPDGSSQITIALNEYAVSDGKPIIDSTEYQATSPEQMSAIQAMLEKTPYRRIPGGRKTVKSKNGENLVFSRGGVTSVTPFPFS